MACSAIFSWTTSDSHALHTPRRCVFALTTIRTAMSRSAVSSTKMWQFPVPVSITGTVLFCTTFAMSPAPPLGIRTSIYLFSFIIWLTTARSVFSTRRSASSGRLHFFKPSRITFVTARLEWIASEPPRRITTFPVLKQSPKASAVTFGRDS